MRRRRVPPYPRLDPPPLYQKSPARPCGEDARVRPQPVSHRGGVSRPAQSYGGTRGPHGEAGGRGGPRRAGNSLRAVGSDVRRRSPGAAVRGEGPRPGSRGAAAEGAADFSSASDGLESACPRGVSRGASGSSLLKIARPSLGFTGVTPEPHRHSLGAAAVRLPAPLPHFLRRFSTAGDPARCYRVPSAPHRLPRIAARRPAGRQPRGAGDSPAYRLPWGFRRRCCARRPVRERRR